MDDENNSDCKHSYGPIEVFWGLTDKTTDASKLLGFGDDAEAANDLIQTKIMR